MKTSITIRNLANFNNTCAKMVQTTWKSKQLLTCCTHQNNRGNAIRKNNQKHQEKLEHETAKARAKKKETNFKETQIQGPGNISFGRTGSCPWPMTWALLKQSFCSFGCQGTMRSAAGSNMVFTRYYYQISVSCHICYLAYLDILFRHMYGL